MIKRPCIAFHFGKSLIGDAEMESKDEKPRDGEKRRNENNAERDVARYRDGERDDER